MCKRTVRIVSVAWLVVSVGCATISGLDQIQESECAPHCGASSSSEASLDVTSDPDAEADGSTGNDSLETTESDSFSVEASADGMPEASDAGVDAPGDDSSFGAGDALTFDSTDTGSDATLSDDASDGNTSDASGGDSKASDSATSDSPVGDSAASDASGVPLSEAGWVASASTSLATNPPGNALDGNPATRWTPGISPAAGQWFEVDMTALHTFREITVDAGMQWAADYMHEYEVLVSTDGSTWSNPIASGVGASQLVTVTFAPVAARYVRIVLTASTTSHWWSIAELDIWD